MMALAMAILCFCPPERSAPLSPIYFTIYQVSTSCIFLMIYRIKLLYVA